ncbi:sulfotransferase 1A1-like [Patiria miniata]|uniref:Sulfotransferase domain-containing protein n=1 Tax=Patiria miniata TaxID=46514 RepID=A0A914ATN6_PATMI|nr:sulfotransferase 1A1-like [Patiria miniata]
MDRVVAELRDFEVREDDVWVVTYPKAGTTWAQEIMSCVMHDGDLEAVNKRHTSFRVSFLELSLSELVRKVKNVPETHRLAAKIPSTRVLKSHLPGPLLPPQIWQKKPKIVYVLRNPKDVVVSYFHFRKLVVPTKAMQAETFDEFLQKMFTGKGVSFGLWWKHYLYFWEKRHEENILILRFEDMKRDLRGNVEKISRFLGKDFPAETLNAITEHCTFANMKTNLMANNNAVFEKREIPEGMSFMRKGKVGDWKSHFTVAQNEAMDAEIKERLKGSGLTFEYD